MNPNLKKVILVSLIILLGLGLLAARVFRSNRQPSPQSAASVATTERRQVFTNDNFHYTIEYPTDWFIDSADINKKGDDVWLAPTPIKHGFEHGPIDIKAFGTNFTFEQRVEDGQELYPENQIETFELNGAKAVRFGSTQEGKIVIQGQPGVLEISYRQYDNPSAGQIEPVSETLVGQIIASFRLIKS